jgi:catechol-2,3-dioxygenase
LRAQRRDSRLSAMSDHGMRAFVLADPDGNCIDIGQPD